MYIRAQDNNVHRKHNLFHQKQLSLCFFHMAILSRVGSLLVPAWFW